jgi:HPt (histidine-containing phosphotransfer) domain-containing protein
MDPGTENALTAALDRMWNQFLPQMHERVAVLEAMAKAFAAGPLSTSQQEQAQAAAHKLAGTLGTFGLTRGTVLARELELIYSQQNEPEDDLAERLASTAAELRHLIDSRK